MSVDEEVCASEILSNTWYLDNGASKRITMNDKNYIEFERFQSRHEITTANGKVLPALGKGTLQIVTVFNNKKQFKELKDVWYVPEIIKNLFSVLAIHDRYGNSRFVSTATMCWLKNDDICVLHGSRSKGRRLFKTNMKVIIPKLKIEVNLAKSVDSLLQLYHERCGHQDKRHEKSFLNHELNIQVNVQDELYEACRYGKAHRYVLFLKQKSDVASALQKVLAYASNSGHILKEVISDNGGEFDNKEVRMFLKKKGVVKRFTAPYTPEQNGGSERENRTIVKIARILKNSNLDVEFPPALWAELINASVYILNRT
ncbi:hypothetical protein AVEN_35779-1 [Araneus ventricosus]|uniref:Integrase catalytic domain-containing protein n=1 Tax=Araneus ventricosus TaxID=182803 RepID=A0A4Y2Q9Y9_ARAVE|nr:hypothetical protein AVEN_35779-1 [Araneus ventricosus]